MSRDSSEDFFNSFNNSPAPAPAAAASSSTATRRPPPPPPPRGSTNMSSASTQNVGSSYYGKSTATAGGSSYSAGAAGGSNFYGSSSAYPSASTSTAPAPSAAAGSSYYGTGLGNTTTTAPSTSRTTSVSSAYSTPAPAPTPAPAAADDWYGVPSSTNTAAPVPAAAPGGGMAFYSTPASSTNPTAASTDATPNTNAANPNPSFSGTIMSGPMGSSTTKTTTTTNTPSNTPYTEEDYENEPPLMEELGINVPHIITKLRAVVFPIGKYTSSHIDESLMQDTDMAGPLAFALALGGELLLSGKVHFGYIYGFGMFGCFAMSLILNLMSPNEAISVWTVMSVLGYALLPVNVLAGINIVLRVQRLGLVGIVLAAVTILWCTVSSTRLFEKGCGLRDQRYLVAYPVSLLYSAFVMITIF